MSAIEQVIELLQSKGYEPDGRTHSETVRFITSASYPLAGREATFGGRQRFALPNTPKRASVGKRTVCLYEREGNEAKNFRNFNTKDVEEIEKAL